METRPGLNVPSGDEIVGETKDPYGTRVVLLDRVWRGKVLVDHPEMALLLHEVLSSVPGHDHAESNPIRYYARNAGPSEWLLVVVSYEQEPARIVSAFANRKDPPTWSA